MDLVLRNYFMLLEMLAEREPNIAKFISRFESLPELIETNSSDESNATILSTIHSSKGQEYDTVFLLDVFDGIIPSTQNIYNTQYYQEERRLFYVAMTRAKNYLYFLSISGRKSSYISEIFPPRQSEKNDIKKPSTASQEKKYEINETYKIGKKVTYQATFLKDTVKKTATVKK